MKYFTAKQLDNLLKTEEDIIVLDTRGLTDFAGGFITGSVLIGHDGNMLEWVKALLNPATPIILVAPAGKEAAVASLLGENGFNNIKGCLDGGFEAWKEYGGETDMIIDVDAGELAMDIPFDENLVVMDVRKPLEYAEGHVKDAMNLPLSDLRNPLSMADLDEKRNFYIHCARGYRSIIAASLLKRQGYNNIRNVVGGWEAIKHARGIEIEKEKTTLN